MLESIVFVKMDIKVTGATVQFVVQVDTIMMTGTAFVKTILLENTVIKILKAVKKTPTASETKFN